MLFHCYKFRSALGYQKLEEAWEDPPLELSEKAQPCQHLDFELIASIEVRE